MNSDSVVVVVPADVFCISVVVVIVTMEALVFVARETDRLVTETSSSSQ